MKKIILIQLLIFSSTIINCFAQPGSNGPYQAGWTNAVLNRDGRTLNTIIYYPSYTEGSETQIDTLHGEYQTIAFGHGFFMQNSYYISIFKHLASYGFVVIAPQFPDNNHLQLGYDLIYCVNYIKSQNTISSSRFYNLIDITKSGLSGHSMGGGASLLASASDSTITVAAPLAAAETNPSAISVMNQIKGVVYLISAQNDGITPPPQNQIPMYNNANPVRGLPIIKGGNHTKFMDTRIWDFTDPNGYLTAAQQLFIARKYLAGIFNLFLKEDSAYFKYAFGKQAQSDTSIIFQYELKPLKPKGFNLISPQGSVNQTSVTFFWHSTYSLNLYDKVQYELTVASDAKFNNVVLQTGQLSDTSFSSQLPVGEYFWKVKAYTSPDEYTFSGVYNFHINNITSAAEEIIQPLEFSLSQNYPNPYNPNTTISFTIGKPTLVTLKLYDLLGNEIATLVNEYKPVGSYSKDFSGADLSSGIYYYRLKAGSFVETKKLLLLK